uniref:Endonuclease/exonuclease/phosphatase domain-containing protein n=1 Tax=Lactuca sativa TaxID=4236 RepID=A0A9R1XQE3_LACSA|nr:hypothetical protein LSAT_V11C300154700 [Lactuca sativa]
MKLYFCIYSVKRGDYIIFSDFNAVRGEDERFRSIFCHACAGDFNDFIDDISVVDVLMVGKIFTRVDPKNVNLNKMDRFLVSESIFDRFQDLQVVMLDRKSSDHRPILIHDYKVDYGPTPCKFYNSWMLLDGFDDLIGEVRDAHKLQLESQIHDIDYSIDVGDLHNERKQILEKIDNLEKLEAANIAKKSKVKWLVEVVENSGFFSWYAQKKNLTPQIIKKNRFN